MRQFPLFVILLLGACQNAPPKVPERGVADDASWSIDASSRRPQVVDPVALSLGQAALAAIEHRRRVALENIANVDVPGWKRVIVRMTTADALATEGHVFQVPSTAETTRDHRQGALQITERPLDLAIDGDGFFAVARPDGSTGYTRNGSLQVDAGGKLVTSQGRVVVPEITFPGDSLEIAVDPEGRVMCRTASSPDTTTMLGQLVLSRFVNAPGLRSDDGLLRATDASGCPCVAAPGSSGLGVLKQGFLERSNVQLANELLELQAIERQYAALAKAFEQHGIATP